MARETAEDDATLEALLLGVAREFQAQHRQKLADMAAKNLVAVNAVQAMAWDPRFIEFEFCAKGVASDELRFAGRFVDRKDYRFEFCAKGVAKDELRFAGRFADRKDYRVLCTTSVSTLLEYPRGKALVSLLHNQCFGGVEEFAVACLNALGADLDTCALEGKIEHIVSVG
jgi:hypothetical protein